VSERNSQEHGRGHGRKKKSEEELWKALPILRGEERIEALNFLGHSAYEREDFASAAIFSEEVAAAWLNENSTLNAVMAFLNASVSWYSGTDLESALETASRAKSLLDDVVIQDGVGHFREVLGERLADLNRFDDALEQFELAVSAFEASSEPHRVAHVMQSISIIYWKQNDLTSAIAAIEVSLDEVHEKEFKPCCVGIVLQWVDLSFKCGLLDRISDVLNDAIESAEALGEKDGLAQLQLRSVIYSNRVQNHQATLDVVSEVEKSKLMKVNRNFQAKLHLEKARALFALNQPKDAEKTLHKSRSLAKSISDIGLICEIDNYELLTLTQKGQYDQAEKLISKLQGSEWYKLHPAAGQCLKVWEAQLLHQTQQFISCLKVIDELLLTELSHNQLLVVMALRAHIVLDSKNGNLARVLVGKSKEIAEASDLEFAKLLFSLWYQVLERSDFTEAKIASAELVQIFLSEDIKALTEKSAELLISVIGEKHA
jgi:tetratricopeptide (TPR) repeat protein